MKKILPEISLLVLLAFMNMLTGCNYFMVKTLQPAPQGSDEISNILNEPKYFILHQGEDTYMMKEIRLDEDARQIACTLESTEYYRLFQGKVNYDGPTRYIADKENPAYEIHIYTSEYGIQQDSTALVPLSAIQRIDIYDKDVQATTASYVFGTLGILAGVATVTYVIIIMLILLFKSSCPFVYTYDGVAYRFTGEIYGGAIYAPLERDDWLPLPELRAANGTYKLIIANELLERQYTDIAELTLVQHPSGAGVLIDKNGEIRTVMNPVRAEKAYSTGMADYTQTIAEVDSNAFLFTDDGQDGTAFSSLTLEFKKPPQAQSGKLILHAKNSLWFDYVFGEFNEMFGTSFNKFQQKRNESPPGRMISWQLSQGIPLSVSVETEQGWQVTDFFNPVGPLAARDLVMPVDLSGIRDETVRIRLSCGYMFWEVDYAAMDFSEDLPVRAQHLAPSSAMDEQGIDRVAELSATDKNYLVQPQPGNRVFLEFPAGAVPAGARQSAFLHTRGYYEYVRDYKNKPDVATLETFRDAGALARFSKEKFNRFASDKNLASKAFSGSR